MIRHAAAMRVLVRNGPLLTALGLAVSFHLMMVTVFAIVIRFPQENEDFLPVDIVHLPTMASASSELFADPPPVLSAPSLQLESRLTMDPSLPFEGGGTERNGLYRNTPDTFTDPNSLLPRIELPKLELSGDRSRRVGKESLQIPSEFAYLFEPKPTQDSWGIFTEELHGFGRAVGRVTLKTLFGDDMPSGELTEMAESIPLTAYSGIALNVRWIGEPQNRAVVFAPPLQELWNINPSQLRIPIRIDITVASDGKVIDVQVPVNDDAGIAEGIGNGLRAYRFEPLTGELVYNQYGTITVAPEKKTP